MAFPSLIIKVTKLDAARQQLQTAIHLSFHNGDPVSIMTLAHAAYEVIHRLFRTRGHKDDLMFGASYIDADYQEQWVKDLKKAPNFFKHSNRGDPDEKIEFESALSDMFMLTSCYALAVMGLKPTINEGALMSWFVLYFPTEAVRKQMAAKGVDVEKLGKQARPRRPEFYRQYLDNIKEGG